MMREKKSSGIKLACGKLNAVTKRLNDI